MHPARHPRGRRSSRPGRRWRADPRGPADHRRTARPHSGAPRPGTPAARTRDTLPAARRRRPAAHPQREAGPCGTRRRGPRAGPPHPVRPRRSADGNSAHPRHGLLRVPHHPAGVRGLRRPAARRRRPRRPRRGLLRAGRPLGPGRARRPPAARPHRGPHRTARPHRGTHPSRPGRPHQRHDPPRSHRGPGSGARAYGTRRPPRALPAHRGATGLLHRPLRRRGTRQRLHLRLRGDGDPGARRAALHPRTAPDHRTPPHAAGRDRRRRHPARPAEGARLRGRHIRPARTSGGRGRRGPARHPRGHVAPSAARRPLAPVRRPGLPAARYHHPPAHRPRLPGLRRPQLRPAPGRTGRRLPGSRHRAPAARPDLPRLRPRPRRRTGRYGTPAGRRLLARPPPRPAARAGTPVRPCPRGRRPTRVPPPRRAPGAGALGAAEAAGPAARPHPVRRAARRLRRDRDPLEPPASLHPDAHLLRPARRAPRRGRRHR